jgi:transposase
MSEPECAGCRALLQRVAQLEAQVAELTRKLEEALRAGKRQAAPFRKGEPKAKPQPPGRKAGGRTLG